MDKRKIALYCSIATAIYAGNADSVHTLADITIKGEAVAESQVPSAITSFNSEDIEKLQINRPEEILKEVSGVEVGDYNQGGVANNFMMRGFGGGGHEGDAAVFIDGIPLNEAGSHGDGYADMNVIIPLEIQSLDVYKGPASALFGNFSRGGTLSFNTKKSGEGNSVRLEYGSNNTVNAQGAMGAKLTDKVYNNTAIQFYQTDGYQESSDWLRGNLSTRFGFDISEKLDMAISARVHGSDWSSPGYIPEEQFNNGDEKFNTAENYQHDGGDKRFGTERFDLGYKFNDNFKLLLWAYGTQQDFTRFAKFSYGTLGQSEKNYDRQVFGTGSSINYKGAIGTIPLDVVGGAEYLVESTEVNAWKTVSRVRYEHSENEVFGVSSISGFAQASAEVNRFFRPLLGIRVDGFGGEYENNKPGEQKTVSDMNDYTAVSPKAGFRTRIIEPLDFHFNYSKGFKLPNGSAKYDTTYALDPVDIKQIETGLQLEISDFLRADLTGFVLDTDNEIQESAPSSGVYKNIGHTRRMGVEFGTSVIPFDGLELYGHVSGLTSEVIKNSEEPELEGKEVSGVPEYIGSVGARYDAPFGLGVGASLRKVGSYAIDDMNKGYYGGYETISADLSYTFTGENDNSYRIFMGCKNLADAEYSQSMWGKPGSYNYAVASPRSFNAGIQMDW